MGNVTVFERAFKECGIGGRFSKFRLANRNDWFELTNVDSLEDSRYCFKIFDRSDVSHLQLIHRQKACELHSPDPQWATHFQTAEKVLAKIVSKGSIKNDNRYYYDHLHNSVVLINRMFVIEVTPVQRVEPLISSSAVFGFLDSHAFRCPSDMDTVQAHTKFDKVVIDFNGQHYNTLLGAEEFNFNFGESV